ncbi:YgfZ/GcvT domain-containing protein [Cohaesibacter haloalkalitolerans]|uniref:CAF17-like 4Fe-4S cluster assembly/insertion protein YgfZ n=1 Tax=Cohaesibacter haloalkalitolerans TaxID=1162980 RepID=UPI0013C4A978|nr:folate-binding protein YgfZ [Cohaesibacter haloalkalitolerans]
MSDVVSPSMSEDAILHLANRAVVRLSGADTESLLQRLVTIDMDELKADEVRHGALLTPQGKIAMDFLICRDGDAVLFDLDQAIVAAFIKKMTLYRMRSDVTIKESDERVGVAFRADADPDALAVRDIRSDLLGWRLYGKGEGWQATDGQKSDYLARHIAAIVPQAGLDFTLEDAFPYDINMDFLGGLFFDKGCYVGQEVVSRMHHRGTARRRLVRVEADMPIPTGGATIEADGKPVGTVGAVLDKRALAVVRLDRVGEALKEMVPLTVKGIPVRVELPDYADFSLDR